MFNFFEHFVVGDSLVVELSALTRAALVRIQVPQPRLLLWASGRRLGEHILFQLLRSQYKLYMKVSIVYFFCASENGVSEQFLGMLETPEPFHREALLASQPSSLLLTNRYVCP